MERLGDALNRLKILENISLDATDDSSSTEQIEDESPSCPRCHDAGYLRADVDVSHPDFGKLFPCSCVSSSLSDERQDRLRRLSQLGPLTRLTFENLDRGMASADAVQRGRWQAAIEAAETFANEPDGWLVLIGPPGCGKTHLAAAIANRRIERGELAIFSVVPDLLDHLRATFAPTSETTYDELFESIKSAPLLVLDDLGTHSSTPWAEEKLFQLLNHRYNERLPTVITTNRRLEELDERLRTRLTSVGMATVCQVQEWDAVSVHRFNQLPARLREMTFEAFDVRGISNEPEHVANLRGALRLTRPFAEQPKDWIILVGVPGSGKTHLAASIANARIARGDPPVFVTVPDLLDYLRSTYAPDSPVRYDAVFDSIRNAPLLILDDLGAQSSTPWAEEKLFQVLNHRYNARLATLITTNLPVERQDSRLRSRMLDQRICTVFNLSVPPYRLDDSADSGTSEPRGRSVR